MCLRDPKPCGLGSVEVHSAQPAVDSVQPDLIVAAIEDAQPGLANPRLAVTSHMNEGKFRGGEIVQYPQEREVPHKERILRLLHREEEFTGGQRAALSKPGKRLALGARQSVIDGGELFQVAA